MKKLTIDHERSSSDQVYYDDLVYVMERVNQLIERIEQLESHIRRISSE